MKYLNGNSQKILIRDTTVLIVPDKILENKNLEVQSKVQIKFVTINQKQRQEHRCLNQKNCKQMYTADSRKNALFPPNDSTMP